MEYRVATLHDIDDVLKLYFRYQVNFIKEEDKKDGFVTTVFTKEELTKLVVNEQGLFVASKDEKIVAYVMSASWKFWSVWPMFEYMIKDLPNLKYLGQHLSIYNSYQYGPICIDKDVRGSGVLEKLFDFSRANMAKKYPILVTFVNKINTRSYEAHKRKLKLKIIQEFEYNNNSYYEMVYDTSKKVI